MFIISGCQLPLARALSDVVAFYLSIYLDKWLMCEAINKLTYKKA
jgi:hypothetical protein